MLSNVSKSLPNDSLKILFNAHIQDQDFESLGSKTALIQRFQHELEALECNSENQTTHLYAISIFSGFSGCLSLAGMSVLNPLLAAAIGFTSVSSALAVIAGSCLHNQKLSQEIPKLKRYALALNSSPAKDWSKLWHIAGYELFLESLVSASKGSINHQGKLIRNDGKNALAVAVDYCADRLHLTRVELLEKCNNLAVTAAPTVIQHQTPPQSEAITVLQSPQTPPPTPTGTPNWHQVALKVLDSLVTPANDRALGGCVIIASPGAGKTTFLGTAWGRLRSKYGDRFQSLAVVVKQSDLLFFKRFATTAICVKHDPIAAAVAVIKFIDAGMREGKITRVFLDDFLTMNLLLDNAVKGVWIEPSTYALSDKKEVGLVPLAGHFHATLNEAWLVGREYNLCLWVSSHSPNIDTLPFCGSRDSRSVGDIIFLAKNNKREFLEMSLSNAHLISNAAKRAELKAALDALDSGNEPIILANNNNWVLGIVPDSIYAEYQTYRTEVTPDSMTNNPPQPTQQPSQVETQMMLEYLLTLSSAERTITHQTSRTASIVLEIIKAGNPPIKFDAIRKSRKWDETPASATVKSGIDELISKELIEGDSEAGYTLAN